MRRPQAAIIAIIKVWCSSGDRAREEAPRRCFPVARPQTRGAVKRIDAIFKVERADERRARVAPLVAGFESWMRAERAKLFRPCEVAKTMDYVLKRWAAFTRFLDDRRICLTNNAAERELRCIVMTDSFCTSFSSV
jgi:transposase